MKIMINNWSGCSRWFRVDQNQVLFSNHTLGVLGMKVLQTFFDNFRGLKLSLFGNFCFWLIKLSLLANNTLTTVLEGKANRNCPFLAISGAGITCRLFFLLFPGPETDIFWRPMAPEIAPFHQFLANKIKSLFKLVVMASDIIEFICRNCSGK